MLQLLCDAIMWSCSFSGMLWQLHVSRILLWRHPHC